MKLIGAIVQFPIIHLTISSNNKCTKTLCLFSVFSTFNFIVLYICCFSWTHTHTFTHRYTHTYTLLSALYIFTVSPWQQKKGRRQRPWLFSDAYNDTGLLDTTWERERGSSLKNKEWRACVFHLSQSGCRSWFEKLCFSSATHIQRDSQLRVWLSCNTTSAWLLHMTTIRKDQWVICSLNRPFILCVSNCLLWQWKDCACRNFPNKMLTLSAEFSNYVTTAAHDEGKKALVQICTELLVRFVLF